MSSPGFQPPPPQRDDLPARTVLLVIAALLALFTVAVVAIVPVMRWGAPREARQARVPPEVGRAELGLVNQRPFALDRRAEVRRQQQLQRLSSYGWVDREAGVIHLPIDRAVELLLRGEEVP